MNPIRIAIADTGSATREVTPLLPANYRVLGRTLDNSGTIIAGRDDAGWTLEGYVIPRLASGLIVCNEIDMIAPTPEQEILNQLEKLESIACELIQDAQDIAENHPDFVGVDGNGICFPEDAAPELDDARGHIRDAIEILNAMEK